MTNSSGSETLLQTSVKGEKVLSPDTADVVCELLQANTNYGTTKAAAVSGFQTMAKTGTTTDEKTVGLPRARPIMCRPPGML